MHCTVLFGSVVHVDNESSIGEDFLLYLAGESQRSFTRIQRGLDTRSEKALAGEIRASN